MRLLNLSGKRPQSLGARDGKLSDCPNAPKCVSSQYDSGRHSIAAFELKGSGADSIAKLAQIIGGMDDAAVVSSNESYLHAEFTTAMLGFVDDVEFLVAGEQLQVRSCSRLGHSDWGVNRTRVEMLRSLYATG